MNDDPRSKELLADVYLDWGNGAKAEEELKRLGLPAQATPDRLTTRGEAYRLMGDLATAEQELKRAISIDPNWAPALNALGNVYLDHAKVEQDKRNLSAARGYLERAKAEYSKAVAAKPSGPPDRNHARGQQALTAAEKTETVAHSNLGEVHLRLGEIAGEEGNSAEAISQLQVAQQAFENSARIDPNYQFAFNGLGDVFREKGETLKDRGDKAEATQLFERAKDQYSQAVRLHNDLAEAYVGLGRVSDDTGQQREALNYYLKAARERPELPDPHYYLARALYPFDRYAAAEQAAAYLKTERDILKQGRKAAAAERVHNGLPPDPSPSPTVSPTPSPSPTPTGPPVRVPRMKGDRPDRALEELRRNGLVGQLQDQRDCEATGRVLSTEPPGDARVPSGSTVTVFVSAAGENAVTVPSLERLDQRAAEEQLRALDLRADVKTTETDRYARYTVFDQKPDAGRRIPAGCSVELKVAIPIPSSYSAKLHRQRCEWT